jgi:uracil phosphoribosyltransferase
MKDYKNVNILDHPLIRHKLAIIRDKKTDTKNFREVIGELATLMAYESFKDIPTQEIEVETPLEKVKQTVVKENSIAIVPILRAGLGMVEGVLSLFPAAKVGHIGLYRDPETALPVEYYCKLPVDCEEREVFVVDPMLATGGSAAAAITMLKEKGIKHIHFLCIIAAPEGVARMQETHPDLDIYIGALDECLNDHGYIVPGLGDAGDRIFGTK